LEFLLAKKLAIADDIRVAESRFSKSFPKVPEERYRFSRIVGKIELGK
jgi:hypothetical protein